MQRETRESAGRVLLPKVHGTQLLSTLLHDEKFDFFLLCSSLRAIAGGTGGASYSAANSFLDAFAQAHESEPGPLTMAVDWDGWIGVGMDLISENKSDAVPGMSAAEGVDA
jgi:polyketide synthase PksJ